MLRKKLKSQRGASIIMALFLFLICAVVGSLVLTAATAAAGRKALAEQTDQRYYSVDSAAGLICDLVTDSSVKVLRMQTQVTEVTDYLEQDETGSSRWVDSSAEVLEPEYGLSFPEYTDRDNDLLVFAAENLIPGYDDPGQDYGFDSEISGSGASKTFSVASPAGLIAETDTSFLDVAVEMTVSENGDLVFTFSSGGTRPYVLKEVFRLLYSETASSKAKESNHSLEEAGESTFTDTYSITETVTKEGVFQWEFVSCSVE